MVEQDYIYFVALLDPPEMMILFAIDTRSQFCHWIAMTKSLLIINMAIHPLVKPSVPPRAFPDLTINHPD